MHSLPSGVADTTLLYELWFITLIIVLQNNTYSLSKTHALTVVLFLYQRLKKSFVLQSGIIMFQC
ncbi:hypothetical protein ANAPC5_00050 [Anaplasma phagocytophilum]|nr:hypothetical protein ANAPC5_00050 [Anaplasma phagocytophilum]